MVKAKRLLIPAILLLFLLGVTLADYIRSHNVPLSGNGTIEGKEVKVIAEVGGKLEKLFVEEGDMVAPGDLLAQIEAKPYQIQVQIAEAQLKSAQSSFDEAKSGARTQEIDAAQHDLEQIKAQVKAAEKNLSFQKSLLDKYENLYKTGALNEQELSTQELQHQQAEQQYLAIKEQEKAAGAKLGLLREGTRQENLNRLSSGIEQVSENLELARLSLSKTMLEAPDKGMVVSCNFEIGEIIRPGSEVLTILDTQELWLNTYVHENKLDKVKVGQEVKLEVDSYPGETFPGIVTFIAPKPEFTPRNLQTKEDRVHLVFRVKVEVTGGQDKLMPGMPSDVYYE